MGNLHMPIRSVLMTMKIRLSLIACFSILLLFLTTMIRAEETGYGWTVGSAYDGAAASCIRTTAAKPGPTRGRARSRTSICWASMPSTDAPPMSWGYRQRLRDHLPNDKRGGDVDQAGSPADVPDVLLAKVHGYGNQKVWAVGVARSSVPKTADRPGAIRRPAAYSTIAFQGIDDRRRPVWATGGNKDGYATILYSDNAGTSWTPQRSRDLSQMDHIIGIAAADNNRLWAVGSVAFWPRRTAAPPGAW